MGQLVFRTSVMENGRILVEAWNADGKQAVKEYGKHFKENADDHCQKLLEQGYKKIELDGAGESLSRSVQRTIIALQGKPNTGKSTTIKLAYDELLSAEADATIHEFRHIGNPADFFAILEIEGTLIGFVNRGDIEHHLALDLAEMKARDCVVIVCAARSNHATAGAVENLRPTYEIRWVPKVASAKSDQQRDNLETAKRILDEVRNALDSTVSLLQT